MYVKTEKRKAVKEPVTFIRNHPNLTNEELAEKTGETEYFVKVVREVDRNPALQRGARASKEWKEQDRKLQRAT